MDIAYIGTSAPIDVIWQSLSGKIKKYSKQNYPLKMEQLPLRDLAMIRFSLDDATVSPQIQQVARQYIASALADIIIEHLEPRIMWHIVNEDYLEYSASDRARIFIITQKKLHNGLDNAANEQENMLRRNRVLYALLEYFADNDTLILEGFINFRLRPYLEQLRGYTDSALQELLLSREKEEFTRLLQYFSKLQRQNMPCIHVVCQPDGEYKLFDKNFKSLQSVWNNKTIHLKNAGITNDDMLLSILIKLSPSKLILHKHGSENNLELIDLLTRIFSNKIVLCSSCDFCKKEH